MDIQIDTREKAHAIQKILCTFNALGVKYYSSKLYVGDYMSLDNPRLVIDRKQDLNELCGNVCQQHDRFIAELKRAQASGIKLVILCEHGRGITSLDDVKHWVNPRLKKSPKAISGPQLHKILSTIRLRYDVDFIFCTKDCTGGKIINILGGKGA